MADLALEARLLYVCIVHLDPEVGWEPLILALLLWPLACLA